MKVSHLISVIYFDTCNTFESKVKKKLILCRRNVHGVPTLQSRAVGTGGTGGAFAPLHILLDQLTLFPKPSVTHGFAYFNRGADFTHHITTCPVPRIFRPSYGPVYVVIPSPNYSPIDSRKALGNQEVCWSLHQVIFRQFDLGPELKQFFKNRSQG